MLRNDENGNADFCRVQFTPVNPAAQALVKRIKLDTNALIGLLLKEFQTCRDGEVQRLLTSAISAYEEASMWAGKALTSEGWGRSYPPFEVLRKGEEEKK